MTITKSSVLYAIGDFAGFVEHVGLSDKTDASKKDWHLVQVSDGLNAGDVDLLRRIQIELYRPLMRSLRLVPKKQLSQAQRRQPVRPLREKIEPFFPGYAFITNPTCDERWQEVFRMTGIRGLVCANHQPVGVPWEMIREIQSREIDGAVPSTTKLMELPYILGQQVRITTGPLADFGGTITRLPQVKIDELADMTIEELDDSHRVHLLVDVFGRSTPVALSLMDINEV